MCTYIRTLIFFSRTFDVTSRLCPAERSASANTESCREGTSLMPLIEDHERKDWKQHAFSIVTRDAQVCDQDNCLYQIVYLKELVVLVLFQALLWLENNITISYYHSEFFTVKISYMSNYIVYNIILHMSYFWSQICIYEYTSIF